MVYSDYELVEMDVEALFVHDTNGKLLRINEPDPTNPAPRFFLARTASGNLWRTRYDLPIELASALEQLATDEPVVTDLPEFPDSAAAYTDLLKQQAPIISVEAGPSYYLPEGDLPHSAVTITSENISLLQAHFSWLLTTLTDYAPVAVAVADGKAVAVCFCSRITAHVAEAGLFTEAAYRGQGYATDGVRGWAAAVRSIGLLPLYGTSWTNNASKAVARKLGAVQYGVNYSIT